MFRKSECWREKRSENNKSVTLIFGTLEYSHLSSNHGGWNKRGGGAKVGWNKLWKKLAHKCNKRGVEGGKNLRNQ